ncbi:MAG: hypothetical protein K0R50_1912 [Eubacterium sp.]|jgi:tetratricopeptide (TPR) repeat protein|nr:hypothetical protein [Eubacterium sp.]
MVWDLTSEGTVDLINGNPNIYLKSAVRALFQNNLSEAITEIDKAIACSDSNKKSYYIFEKTKILCGSKHYDESSKLIEAYLKQFYMDFSLEKFKEVLNLLSRSGKYDSYKMEGLLSQSNIPWVLTKELENKNNSYAYFEAKAEKCSDEGDYSRAICYSDLALSIDDNSNACFIKANCCYALNELHEALSFFDKTLKLNIRHHAAYYKRALILTALKRYRDALESFDAAIQITPTEINYINEKAHMLIGIGSNEEAEILLSGAIAANIGDARTSFLLGQAYDNSNKYSLALRSYKVAASLDSSYFIPDNPERSIALEFRRKRIKIFAAGSSGIIVAILLIVQLILFRSGILHPKIYDFEFDELDKSFLVDQSVQLKESHKVIPFYAGSPDVKWVIGDPEIASVDAKNVLRGIKGGQTKISAVINNKVIKTYDVSFVLPEMKSFSVYMDGQLNKIGDSGKVVTQLVMSHKNAKLPEIGYSSSDEKVVTVDSEGNIRAIGVGDAFIKVEVNNKYQTLKVSVQPLIKGISIKYNHFELEPDQKVRIIPSIDISPEGAEIPALSYEVQNDILKVDNDGTVQAIKPGYSQVTVGCGNFIENVYITVGSGQANVSELNSNSSGKSEAGLKSENTSSEQINVNKVYSSNKYGFSIYYPATFSKTKTSQYGDSVTFSNRRDNSEITVYSSKNASRLSASRLMDQYINRLGLKVSYKVQKDNYYILSWEVNGLVKYQKTIVGEKASNSYLVCFPKSLKNECQGVIDILNDSFYTPNIQD